MYHLLSQRDIMRLYLIVLTLLAATCARTHALHQHLTAQQIAAAMARIHQITQPAAYQRLAKSIHAHAGAAQWHAIISNHIAQAQQHSGSFTGEVARARLINLKRLQQLLLLQKSDQQ